MVVLSGALLAAGEGSRGKGDGRADGRSTASPAGGARGLAERIGPPIGQIPLASEQSKPTHSDSNG